MSWKPQHRTPDGLSGDSCRNPTPGKGVNKTENGQSDGTSSESSLLNVCSNSRSGTKNSLANKRLLPQSSLLSLAQDRQLLQSAPIPTAVTGSRNRYSSFPQRTRSPLTLQRSAVYKWHLHDEKKKKNGSPRRKRIKTEAGDDDTLGGDDTEDDTAGAEEQKRKIPICYITDKGKRHVCFSKRMSGLIKKTEELTVLTGSQALLIIASDTNQIHTFSTPKFRSLLTSDRYRSIIESYLAHSDRSPVIEDLIDSTNFAPNDDDGTYDDLAAAAAVVPPDSQKHKLLQQQQQQQQQQPPPQRTLSEGSLEDIQQQQQQQQQQQTSYLQLPHLPILTTSTSPGGFLTFPVGPIPPAQQLQFTQQYLARIASATQALNSNQFPFVSLPFFSTTPQDWSFVQPPTTSPPTTTTTTTSSNTNTTNTNPTVNTITIPNPKSTNSSTNTTTNPSNPTATTTTSTIPSNISSSAVNPTNQQPSSSSTSSSTSSTTSSPSSTNTSSLTTTTSSKPSPSVI